jgi:predicted nucleotidyltransferase
MDMDTNTDINTDAKLKRVVQKVYHDLELDDDHVLNMYVYGSHIYGYATPMSDFDIIIVTDYPDDPYTKITNMKTPKHDFTLHKDPDGEYDVVMYNLENYKKLLQINVFYIVECLFVPDRFKIKNTMDLREYYLEHAFNPRRLLASLYFENRISNTIAKYNMESNRKKALRNYFHMFRYCVFGYQLLTTRSISDFKSGNIYYEKIMNHMDDKIDYRGLCKSHSEEYDTLFNKVKIKVNELQKEVKGTFEFHITVQTDEDEKTNVKTFKKYCLDHKLKPIVILLDKGKHPTQVMTSSYHNGVFPDNINHINEVAQGLKDAGFKLKRVKIESMASNKGVPTTPELHATWDKNCYFEFHYKIHIDDKDQLRRLTDFCTQWKPRLYVSKNQVRKKYNFATLRMFECGREKAFEEYQAIEKALLEEGYKINKIEREFVVYDNNLELDAGW